MAYFHRPRDDEENAEVKLADAGSRRETTTSLVLAVWGGRV